MPHVEVHDKYPVKLYYTLHVGESAHSALGRVSSARSAAAASPEGDSSTTTGSTTSDAESGAGPPASSFQRAAAVPHSQHRVLFVMGLAACGNSEYLEGPLQHLLSLQDAHGRPLVCACTFDNRGVGLSTIPQRWHHYSSTIMAEDVAQLLDHLGWHSKVHLVGQSLGANVCMKAAAKQPDRFASLTMLGGVLSGMHMLKNACLQTPRLTVTNLFGSRSEKLACSLKFHFTKDFLEADTGNGKPRLQAMVEKLEGEIAERRALQPDRRIAAARKKGRWGQLWATAMHSMKGSEERAIRHAPHLRPLVLHGWEDRLISPSHLQKLGHSLGARMLAVPAGHAGIGIEACETIAHAFQNQILGGGVLGTGSGVPPSCQALRYPGMHTLGGACSEGLDDALERGSHAESAGGGR
ncbi:hypothetical protein ACKKBG_A06615 [Auxenochlorella protothecoides x Auxenochlorella symbiontica]